MTVIQVIQVMKAIQATQAMHHITQGIKRPERLLEV